MQTLKELGITKAQLARILRGKKVKPQVLEQNISDNVFKVGIVSDTHLCSTEERLDELHTFYAIMKKEGIKTIFHAGDLVAGWGIYRGQENEVHTFGAQGQARFAIKNYPKVRGIVTYFITGNHDLSFWKTSGVDIGELVAEKRPDMIYLGQYIGNVELNGVRFRIMHPDGGGSYALSYRAQKISEQIPSGDKPQILLFGHWHTAHYFFYRNMHIFNCACFEGQTSFLLRKGINPIIGGWTATIRVGTDEKHPILSMQPCFIPFM